MHRHTFSSGTCLVGQHGTKDMHILKVNDWKELTCRHSEEFDIQAWHAQPRIYTGTERELRDRNSTHGVVRNAAGDIPQSSALCIVGGLIDTDRSYGMYIKRGSLCRDLCWHVAARLRVHAQFGLNVGGQRGTVWREISFSSTFSLLLHIVISFSIFSHCQSCQCDVQPGEMEGKGETVKNIRNTDTWKVKHESPGSISKPPPQKWG